MIGSIPQGATAVVTGVSRGIGLATAVALAHEGVDVVGIASTERTAEASREPVERLGRRYWGIGADLGDRTSLYRALERIAESVEVPDILVHAAGINRRAPIVDHGDELWDEVLAVNVTAPFILSREIGRGMVERGSGKIVFLASLLSFQGGLTVPGYAASKGGVAQLVKALSNEWASHGVNVNAIAPGYVDTDMNSALIADEERFAQISDRIPAGRWARPSDIAGAVVFLSSPASDYVNGTVLPVDGGWLGR
ncbi:SDR family oxidoreductase [Microcella sp.]|uniref:SDR family oxidoreductase n=1 Tax=Microcella sp. TaxID=1913979 RepID=UPI00255D9F92|nr:SDR family oxidoreductase [Microcella sp.]MBX9472328.1 SDR family oxidoreductase [Microcella sp.]